LPVDNIETGTSTDSSISMAAKNSADDSPSVLAGCMTTRFMLLKHRLFLQPLHVAKWRRPGRMSGPPVFCWALAVRREIRLVRLLCARRLTDGIPGNPTIRRHAYQAGQGDGSPSSSARYQYIGRGKPFNKTAVCLALFGAPLIW
jgi:hypothetical protein